MQHLDPDRLVLLALSEDVADVSETAHLVDCGVCRTEVHELGQLAEISAETQDLRELPPPPERVWAGIAAAVTTPPTAPDRVWNGIAATVAQQPSPERPVTPPSNVNGLRPATTRPSRHRRWATPVLAAAAAAVLAVAGTVTVLRLTDKAPPPPAVTARAELKPLPAAPAGTSGDARVLSGDRIEVDLRDLPPASSGYYEVWLLDPKRKGRMTSLGPLPANAGDAVLQIPPGTDLSRFNLVDVSAEPNDGDSAHSGRSLLRGTLTS